jgi:cysteine desulfurase/selenocysteine lyase
MVDDPKEFGYCQCILIRIIMQMTRASFPFFEHNPNLVYLDSAGTTQKPQKVLEAMYDYYLTHNTNPHSGNRFTQISQLIINQTRQKTAEFLGIRWKSIIFTKNATEGFNLVAYSWGQKNLKSGDTILISKAEHNANLLPWLRLAQEKNLHIQYIDLDPNGNIDTKHVADLIDERKPKLVAIHHISNVVGQVQDVEVIGDLCRDVGAVCIVDGTQAVGHIPVDLSKSLVDFYIFSSHKMYGPHGVGVIAVNLERYPEMQPFLLGGGPVQQVSEKSYELVEPPELFEPGTPNIADIAGFSAALELLKANTSSKGGGGLITQLVKELQSIAGLEIIGNQDPNAKVSLVSFTHKTIDTFDIATLLGQQNIIIRQGKHCADLLHQELEIPGSLRVSLGIYNSEDDITGFVSALKDVLKKLS